MYYYEKNYNEIENGSVREVNFKVIFMVLILALLMCYSSVRRANDSEETKGIAPEYVSSTAVQSIGEGKAEKTVAGYFVNETVELDAESGKESVTYEITSTISFKLEGVSELPEDWEISPKEYVEEVTQGECDEDFVIVYNVTNGFDPEDVHAASKSLDVYF